MDMEPYFFLFYNVALPRSDEFTLAALRFPVYFIFRPGYLLQKEESVSSISRVSFLRIALLNPAWARSNGM
jgi:hypothetical protein